MSDRLSSKGRGPKQTDRRSFLRNAAAGAALIGAPASQGQPAPPAPASRHPPPTRSVPPVVAAQSETAPPPAYIGPTQKRCSSDFMIDTFRHLGIDHVAFIPGNTFKGLHESLINYGMLTEPKVELITCMHEEASVAVAHGYAKVAGKPMACMFHSTVGLQHASMALYNAWADRVPVYAIVGAQLDASRREDYVDWVHSVFDGPALVRDFTKWDDTPASLSAFAASAIQAYKFAMTPPYGPVLLALDQDLQEAEVTGDYPALESAPRMGEPSATEAAAKECAALLAAAENPVILVDRCARTAAGMFSLIELAEVLQAAVIDAGARMNFPWRHPLNQSSRQAEALADADVVLALEMTDLYGTIHGVVSPTAKIISISSIDLYMKANYQDFQHFTSAHLAIAADAEASLPMLLEAIRRVIRRNSSSARATRGRRLADLSAATLRSSRELASAGWNDQPISTARMCMEIYDKVRTEDWALVSGTIFQSMWPQRLWHADRPYQYIGDSGAYGLGYLPGASVGAALAHRAHGRLPIAIGGDGDLMFSPGALWTAAHHKVPLLYVVHNNRSYHMEVMYVQSVANRRNRGIDRARIGNSIDNPHINFSQLANSMGVYAEGPITDPAALGPALARAIEVVKRGGPALVDVVSQGR